MFNADYERVKLIDLGVSSRLDNTKATKAAGKGTQRYMPPEQLNGKLSFKTDIWAFGCVLLEFCSGLAPFNEIENEMALCMEIIFKKSNPLEYAMKNNMIDMDLVNDSPAFKRILESCFKKDYRHRPSAEQLFNDPFFDPYTTE